MVKLFAFTPFWLPCLAAVLLTSASRLTAAASQGRRGAAGVFMVIEGGTYTFNYSVARATCQRLNVTMATTRQMERALREGLETCKFGWIDERIAVIPRLTSDGKCGKGQTGLAAWHASLDTKFAVFCYNASELNGTATSPAEPRPSTPSTTPILRTQTQTPVTPPVTSARSPSSTGEPATSPEQKLPTLTVTDLVKTTRPTRTPPTAPATRHGVTTEPPVVRFTFWTAVHSSGVLSSSEPVPTRSVIILTENSPGAGPTALIILGVVAFLLMASAAVWYHKPSAVRCGSQRLRQDDPETEMWKHGDSEMDLRNQPEDGEEEEPERKYSSEITLCVNPSIKAKSSE